MAMMPSLFDLSDEATTEPQLEGAGFRIRALARGIDLLIHLGVSFVAGMVGVLLTVLGAALQEAPPDAALAKLGANTPLGFLAALLGGLALHTLCEGLHGSTPGKRICGLTVVGEGVGAATLAGALKRNIAYYWDAFFFGMVAAHKMAESSRRQRFGDIWGQTQVVHLSALPRERRRSGLRFLLAVLAGLIVDGTLLLAELGLRLA